MPSASTPHSSPLLLRQCRGVHRLHMFPSVPHHHHLRVPLLSLGPLSTSLYWDGENCRKYNLWRRNRNRLECLISLWLYLPSLGQIVVFLSTGPPSNLHHQTSSPSSLFQSSTVLVCFSPSSVPFRVPLPCYLALWVHGVYIKGGSIWRSSLSTVSPVVL